MEEATKQVLPSLTALYEAISVSLSAWIARTRLTLESIEALRGIPGQVPAPTRPRE